MSDPAINSTTQEFLDVYDIINDMVLLKDGTSSIILQVGTMNFSLLAEQEQDAVIFTYGSLLNSLNYPIQINIQSQTKDATKYLRLLDDQIEKSTSDRKVVLIKKYRNFVAKLIKERNVLEKKFYIVVPASPGEMGLITPSRILPGNTTFDISSVEKSILLEKATNILEPRRDHLIAQFNRLGLYAKQLNTQEIIQNFYINYNPEAAEGQEIATSESYTTPLVRASFGNKPMINQAIQNIPANIKLGQTLQPQTQELPAEEKVQITPPDLAVENTIVEGAVVEGAMDATPTTDLPTSAPWENQDVAEESIVSETPIFDAKTNPQAMGESLVEESIPTTLTEQLIENQPTIEPALEQLESEQSVELPISLDHRLLQTQVDQALSDPTALKVDPIPLETAPEPEPVSADFTPSEPNLAAPAAEPTPTPPAPEIISEAEPATPDFSEEVIGVQSDLMETTTIDSVTSPENAPAQTEIAAPPNATPPVDFTTPIAPATIFDDESDNTNNVESNKTS